MRQGYSGAVPGHVTGAIPGDCSIAGGSPDLRSRALFQKGGVIRSASGGGQCPQVTASHRERHQGLYGKEST
jgi:hypothetical protein